MNESMNCLVKKKKTISPKNKGNLQSRNTLLGVPRILAWLITETLTFLKLFLNCSLLGSSCTDIFYKTSFKDIAFHEITAFSTYFFTFFLSRIHPRSSSFSPQVWLTTLMLVRIFRHLFLLNQKFTSIFLLITWSRTTWVLFDTTLTYAVPTYQTSKMENCLHGKYRFG